LETALEKARLKEVSDKYNSNGNNNHYNNDRKNIKNNNVASNNLINNNMSNNLKYSISEFNDITQNTTKSKAEFIYER